MLKPRKRVHYVYPPLFKYRAPFQEAVRRRLAQHGVDYNVLFCDPPDLSNQKADTCELAWATRTPIFYLGPQRKGLIFQGALKQLKDSDLIVMQQENKLLVNYFIHLRRLFTSAKIAYFGHGRNFQAAAKQTFADRLKRFWATKVDWWFAYNDLSARVVESYGFPRERITSFRNSIDMKRLLDEVAAITPADLAARRQKLALTGEHVGIFVGGIYHEKRMAFLVEAANRIRAAIPDFELLVVGGGPDLKIVQEAASSSPFIHALGPRYGREKTELALLAQVFLMPGLVGLAVLDSFGYGIPMVTTDYPFHSPEIDYLKDGVNGRIVTPWQDVDAYVGAVIELFRKPELRARLSHNARAASAEYSIEDMAQRFSDGVLKVLESA